MSALILQPTVLSEVGLRGNNEDAAYASPRLVAVADGVGGATAGELASNLAIMKICLLYTSPSPRDGLLSRMPSSA